MNLTEQRQILELIVGDEERARSSAMATIVRTEGSTYRRAGARLLVNADGPILGNLSGGCLEGEMTIEAERVLADGLPTLLIYDLSADDEAIWGWGLGCNGTMEVFIEPAATWRGAARSIAAALDEGRSVAIATTITSHSTELVGSHLVMMSDGSIAASTGRSDWDEKLVAPVREALATRRHTLISIEDARIFIEALVVPDVLVIFGAGHDAVPVGRVCSELGFEIVVVDDRDTFLSDERFPNADAFLKPAQVVDLEKRYPDANLHAVVMTHNYLRDLDYLEMLSNQTWTYVGVLGPQRRLQRLLRDLEGKGTAVTEEWRSLLHGPAGLDLGAEGPEEIAVAIAAELLAVRNGRGGGFLRERGSPIHGA